MKAAPNASVILWTFAMAPSDMNIGDSRRMVFKAWCDGTIRVSFSSYASPLLKHFFANISKNAEDALAVVALIARPCKQARPSFWRLSRDKLGK